VRFFWRLFPLLFLFLGSLVFAQEVSRAAVLWLPTAIVAEQPTLAVLKFSGPNDWEVRLYVKGTEHYSGSVQRGESFTSGYIPLEELLVASNLIFKIKISSVLPNGEAEWRLALRKKGGDKKIGEISLGKVLVIKPTMTLEGSTQPSGWVGLFLDEKERLPYLITLADASGKFSLKTDRAGKLFLLKEDGSREEIKQNEGIPVQGQQSEASADVFISALLPNPASPLLDTQDEWIEIATTNNTPQDISGYRLSDTLGTSKEYILPAGSIVSKEKPLKVFSKESKIALNNEGDIVVLKTPDGRIVSESVKYPSASAGAVWFKDGSEWLWQQDEEADSYGTIVSEPSSQGTATSSQSQPLSVEIGELNKLASGTFISTLGRVSGKTSTGFYLADGLGNKIRIFLNKAIRGLKDLVKNSELWQVTGKLEVYAGSLRLSPQNESDLQRVAESSKTEVKPKEESANLNRGKNSSSSGSTVGVGADSNKNQVDKSNTNSTLLSSKKPLAEKRRISYPLTQVVTSLVLWWGILLKIR